MNSPTIDILVDRNGSLDIKVWLEFIWLFRPTLLTASYMVSWLPSYIFLFSLSLFLCYITFWSLPLHKCTVPTLYILSFRGLHSFSRYLVIMLTSCCFHLCANVYACTNYRYMHMEYSGFYFCFESYSVPFSLSFSVCVCLPPFLAQICFTWRLCKGCVKCVIGKIKLATAQ